MSEDVNYNMIMPFKDQSESFSLGFECGQMWQMMHKSEHFKRYIFNAKNKTQVEMMLKRHHYKYEFEDLADGWLLLNCEIDKSKAN